MRVGFVYDPIFLEHETGNHPENPDRLRVIKNQMDVLGLTDELSQVIAIPASFDDLALVHVGRHIRTMERMSEYGGGYYDGDTVLSAMSYQAALYAAGGSIVATNAVLAGQLDRVFALVRPPGHHALTDRAMGFCLFNNIAIAAAWAQQRRGLERVSIVDIDVHHGNGTQAAFDHNAGVQYISVHQHPFFPFTGDWHELCTGPNGPTCLNVPIPAFTGDVGYDLIARRLIEPSLDRFAPELIMMSIGYDTHFADPLAWMNLSLAGSMKLIETCQRMAEKHCNGRMVLFLEGGYEQDVLRHGVAATFQVLLGRSYVDPFGANDEPEPNIGGLVNDIAALHQLA